jgi:site-specific DNA-methyltransferase (adenine-specific)
VQSNTLYCGDNLDILRREIADESVDLVYLDPPFNSQRDYRTPAGERAFGDAWAWDDTAASAFAVARGDGRLAGLLDGLRGFLGEGDLLAYLAMMAVRLVELHRVLAPTGSLYLHCDPTASHYLKLLLDGVFGRAQFRNEIVWAYKSGGASRRRFSRKHDILLYYARDAARCRFTPLKEKSYNRGLKPYRFHGVDEYEDETGWHTLVNMKDVWQIDMVGRTSRERMGYPTQKPLALLTRIVEASSLPGDVVLDPCCGCGTTLHAAQALGRRWIGIDANPQAIALTEARLRGAFPGAAWLSQ